VVSEEREKDGAPKEVHPICMQMEAEPRPLARKGDYSVGGFAAMPCFKPLPVVDQADSVELAVMVEFV
jgi:hypothetical protein